MGVKLYAVDWSPPVRATMMTLEIFNVPFEKIDMNLMKLDHMKPEYLKKNPLHTVPFLEDGDVSVFDSHAIIMYLADTYGKDDSWYPKDIKKRAAVNQKLFFNTSILFPRARAITFPILVEGNKVTPQNRLDDLAEAFSFLEEFLSRTKYVAADHITIADVAVFTSVTAMDMIMPIDPEKLPKVHAWYLKMKDTPYAKKYNEYGAAMLSQMIKKCLEQ